MNESPTLVNQPQNQVVIIQLMLTLDWAKLPQAYRGYNISQPETRQYLEDRLKQLKECQ